MQATRLATRLQRELRMLQSDPPPGVCAWPCNDSLSHLEAQIQGPDGTVYERGLFKLEIRVPDRYPFEPPSVRFKTPIYHPNIDSGGRICLDILNMPPKGAWKPSLNIPTILASIGLLLAEPNPDDGLMGEITAEYKHNRLSFDMTATKWTQQYALQKDSVDGGDSVRIPVQHDGVQQKTSISAVKVSAPAALSGLETQDNRLQESTTGLQEAQTSSSENRTKATNKLGKCSVGSTSKLVLGAKLSLEKGSKDSGKRSYINTADADISAVTSKRALSCIDNTVGTRQVTVQKSQPLESSMDIAKVKGTGNDTHEHPSGDSPELYPKRDKVNNLKPESVKSRICVASDARPVRIPLTCRAVDRVFLLEKNQVCQSDHAATSTVQKGSLEISERRLTSSISPVSISSKKAVPAYMLDDNYERSGESRREAGHLKNVHSSIIGSDSESNQRDRYFAAAPVVRGCAPPLIPVANASRDTSVADHESPASGLVQNNLKSRSKCPQGTNADIVWITGESSAGKKGSIAGVDRLDMARKPTKPSKPATNVIVLDSESDDEPPKGRSRLSLSRRRGVKNKTKD